MKKIRLDFIDVAKGIATLLVIIGHLDYTPENIKIWLYSFHIPLFFFLSGFVINYSKYNSFHDFLIDKVKKNIVSYFYLSLITWIIVECIRKPLNFISFQKLLGIFICARGTPYYLTLWFVISLFFAQIVVYFVSKIENKRIICFSFCFLFLVGVIVSMIYKSGWIFVSDTIPMASFFVGLGYLAQKNFKYLKKYMNIYTLFLCFFFNMFICFINLNGITRVDLYYQQIGNPILFLLASLSGIAMIIIFSKYIHTNSLFKFIGMNSLTFYAFHRPIFIPIVQFIVNKFIPSEILLFGDGFFIMIFALIIICSGLSILSYFINKYFPFIVNKKPL